MPKEQEQKEAVDESGETTDGEHAGPSGGHGKRSRGDDKTKGGRGTRQKTGDG